MVAVQAALVQVWDHDWNLVGDVESGWRLDEPSTITLPIDHPICEYVANMERERDCYLSASVRAGKRWIGRLDEFRIVRTDFAGKYIVAQFTHMPSRMVDYGFTPKP